MEQQISKVQVSRESLQQQLKEVSDSLLNFSVSKSEAEQLKIQLQSLLSRLNETR
ncbi:hypothetical protein QTP81_13925 [Alteromonas sp. ASW11-36]|uniref:DUF904 domain-containing protein n=1 Tax=Alteromonas arenosi TaxID=3055817 RepID=A0ABT7SZT7_9ALTE|nr:hypothetical protein [Alteromonas sp. ASW11-36]MDM7861695.1 hypothetical protein [Alteromonas sp. ASW11-36]